MYSQNDYRLYLEHSWGKKPEQKAAEKAYNQKYYQEHKSKWAQYRENAIDKLGGTAKKEANAKGADYIAKGNDWDRKVAFDGRYLNNQSYEAKVKAHRDWENAAWEYQQALLRYEKTPLGRLDSAVTAGKRLLGNKTAETWVDTKYKTVSNDELHKHSKRNMLWQGDQRYERYHPRKAKNL
jgi:hypothetical protein